jgi:hypothetical protein
LVLAAGTWRSRALVARRQRARRARAHRDFPWARTPRPASAHRSGRGGSLSREPTLRPSPLAPRASRTRDGRTDPHRPAYGVLSVPWPCRAPVPRPAALARKATPPPPLLAYKKSSASSSRAVRPCQSRAAGRHYCRRCRTPVPLVFSSVQPFKHSPRLCRSSHPRLLLRPSRNSPEQQPPAAAAAGLCRAHPPALFPPQVST